MAATDILPSVCTLAVGVKKFRVILDASIRQEKFASKAVSLAHVARSVLGLLRHGRSEVNRVHKTGPRTLPWGTPARTILMLYLSLLTSTIKLRLSRYDFNRTNWPVGIRDFNLWNKPSCHTRSKASLTSTKIAELYCLFSKAY